MNVEPFIRVDATPFAATVREIESCWGAPLKRFRNSVELNELDYGHIVFRFQDCGRLEEITKLAPVVFIADQAILFPLLADFVRSHDREAFERAGFLVSPKYGLAFDPACPSWVTALARHCIDTWRRL